MASPSSCRCLLRARLPLLPSLLSLPPRQRPFSTSHALHLPAPPKPPPLAPRRSPSTNGIAQNKKKSAPSRGKPPAPGERKAMRKRVSLTNPNALPVPGLAELGPATMADPQLVGSMLALGQPLVDQLRAVLAFKPTQGWSWFRRPATLVRAETVRLAELVKAGEGGEVGRLVLDGERGAGKSVLLLQAMALAFARGWTVVSIPEAQDLTIGQTEYAAVPNTSPPQYTQTEYTRALLAQISEANAAFLASHPVTLTHTLPITLPPALSLQQLLHLGTRDATLAPAIFEALWAELTAPGRPPLLLALDGLGHIMGPTRYRSVAHTAIHALDFQLPRHFAACLDGSAALPNGGLVLAATSGSNVVPRPALALALARARGEGGGAGRVHGAGSTRAGLLGGRGGVGCGWAESGRGARVDGVLCVQRGVAAQGG